MAATEGEEAGGDDVAVGNMRMRSFQILGFANNDKGKYGFLSVRAVPAK